MKFSENSLCEIENYKKFLEGLDIYEVTSGKNFEPWVSHQKITRHGGCKSNEKKKN